MRHDYPTADAYEAACKALAKYRDRADRADFYIQDLERRLKEVEDAARAVCWYDFSDADEDCRAAVSCLREALGPEPPIGDDPNQ